MQDFDFTDVSQHETGPEISSNPATPHDVVSTTEIPEIISPEVIKIPEVISTESGSAHPDQELFVRNRSFFDNRPSPDLSEDSSNLNKVSPNKGQQEGRPFKLKLQLHQVSNCRKNCSQPSTSLVTQEKLGHKRVILPKTKQNF